MRWLYQNTPHYDKYDSSYGETIQHALHGGEDELVELLLPPGRCVLDYADDCPRVDVIEWMLDCGYLHRDAGLAVRAIRDLVESGRLDLMQQIARMHSPVLQDCQWDWSAFHILKSTAQHQRVNVQRQWIWRHDSNLRYFLPVQSQDCQEYSLLQSCRRLKWLYCETGCPFPCHRQCSCTGIPECVSGRVLLLRRPRRCLLYSQRNVQIATSLLPNPLQQLQTMTSRTETNSTEGPIATNSSNPIETLWFPQKYNLSPRSNPTVS